MRPSFQLKWCAEVNIAAWSTACSQIVKSSNLNFCVSDFNTSRPHDSLMTRNPPNIRMRVLRLLYDVSCDYLSTNKLTIIFDFIVPLRLFGTDVDRKNGHRSFQKQ